MNKIIEEESYKIFDLIKTEDGNNCNLNKLKDILLNYYDNIPSKVKNLEKRLLNHLLIFIFI